MGGLVLMWHAAAMLSTAYFYSSGDLFMILSMAAFATCCSIIEGQHVGYQQSSKQLKSHWLIISISTLAAACSTGIIVLLVLLFNQVPAAKSPVGDIAPSVLLGLGFLPQYYTFASTWSIKGYSFGVTALDVMGSVANAAVLFAPAHVQVAKAAAEAAPFLVIICMHAGLVVLAAVILCSSKLRSPDRGENGTAESTQDGVGVSTNV